jgi:hypothetical protein
MIKWLARVESGDLAGVLDGFLRCRRSCPLSSIDLLAEKTDDHVRVGIDNNVDLLPLAVAHRIFACAASLSTDIDFKFLWISSSIETRSTELPGLIGRWNETEEPPVLSLLALELGEWRHLTRGLTMFAGRDLEVRFSQAERSRDAALSLARLARYALMTGVIARDRAYEGIDGRALRLDWHDDLKSSTMVTIVL